MQQPHGVCRSGGSSVEGAIDTSNTPDAGINPTYVTGVGGDARNELTTTATEPHDGQQQQQQQEERQLDDASVDPSSALYVVPGFTPRQSRAPPHRLPSQPGAFVMPGPGLFSPAVSELASGAGAGTSSSLLLMPQLRRSEAVTGEQAHSGDMTVAHAVEQIDADVNVVVDAETVRAMTDPASVGDPTWIGSSRSSRDGDSLDASRVEEEGGEDHMYANGNHARKRTTRFSAVLIGAGVLVMIAVAVGVGVAVGGGNVGGSSGSNNMSSPSEGSDSGTNTFSGSKPGADLRPWLSGEESDRLFLLRDVLEKAVYTHTDSGIDDGARGVLRNRTTAQYRALYWLANEDDAGLLSEVHTNNNTFLDMDSASGTSVHETALADQLIERYALAVLYYSTNGEEWEDQCSFLSANHVCQWQSAEAKVREWHKGVSTCTGGSEDEGKAVQELVLVGNDLRGTIPWAELVQLGDLTRLSLAENSLKGTISPQIGDFGALKVLDLNVNDISGAIPTSIANLETLLKVSLTRNDLTGTLVTMPPYVNTLTLSRNELTGTVPQSYASLALTELHLEKNSLTGSIDFLCDAYPPGVSIYVDEGEVDCRCCNF